MSAERVGSKGDTKKSPHDLPPFKAGWWLLSAFTVREVCGGLINSLTNYASSSLMDAHSPSSCPSGLEFFLSGEMMIQAGVAHAPIMYSLICVT